MKESLMMIEIMLQGILIFRMMGLHHLNLMKMFLLNQILLGLLHLIRARVESQE